MAILNSYVSLPKGMVSGFGFPKKTTPLTNWQSLDGDFWARKKVTHPNPRPCAETTSSMENTLGWVEAGEITI